MVVSKINSQITIDFLKTKKENQYFERKGIGEKDTNPTKFANEIIEILNSEGGTLIIGVDDDGKILGLEDTDFASFKGDNKKDEFVKHFDNLIQNYFGNDRVHQFNIVIEGIDNKTIAIISIANKATEPIIIKNPEKNNQEEFYVRRNASAIGLTMYEMFNYSKDYRGQSQW